MSLRTDAFKDSSSRNVMNFFYGEEILFDIPGFSYFLQLSVSSLELTFHGRFPTSQCSSMPPWAKRKLPPLEHLTSTG